jgi:hypothetical protein
MFLHDPVKDVYHLLGIDNRKTRCEVSCDDFWLEIVLDGSTEGKICGVCEQVKVTLQHKKYMQAMLQDL